MNTTGFDIGLLSIKKQISWRGSGVLQGLEEQLESSQDSPEAGNLRNRIDLTKLPLVKDKKRTGQSEIVVQVLSIVSGETGAATKQFTPSTFFC